MLKLFSFYKRTPSRLRAFEENEGSYLFRSQSHGHGHLRSLPAIWKHNCGDPVDSQLLRKLMYYVGKLMNFFSFPIGDVPSVLRNLRSIHRSNLILATVENVGLPLLLTRWLGLWSTPFFYTSIGLPERLVPMHPIFKDVMRSQLKQASLVYGFGYRESQDLDDLINGKQRYRRTPVVHVPYGVPLPEYSVSKDIECQGKKWDVISVGADPNRDYRTLLHVAEMAPKLQFLIIASRAFEPLFLSKPDNVSVEYEQPLERVIDCMLQSRLIVLPTRENTYSGAVTTAFLSMSLGRPTLLTKVSAIECGYQFVDAENCFLVEEGLPEVLLKKITSLIDDPKLLQSVGEAGKLLVQECYTDRALGARLSHFVKQWERQWSAMVV